MTPELATTDAALDVLHRVFGYDSFRGEQADIIRQLVGGGDEQVIFSSDESSFAELWAGDGSYLFVYTPLGEDMQQGWDLWLEQNDGMLGEPEDRTRIGEENRGVQYVRALGLFGRRRRLGRLLLLGC